MQRLHDICTDLHTIIKRDRIFAGDNARSSHISRTRRDACLTFTASQWVATSRATTREVFILLELWHIRYVGSLPAPQMSSGETSGPEIIALITGLPSSLFPALVALKASIDCSKESTLR